MANEFILERDDQVIGRVLFDWDSRPEWLIRNVRLADFTDQALKRDLTRLLERNEPQLSVAGGRVGDLRRFYEGLCAALWWLQEHGGSFQWSPPMGVPDREEDPLADN